MPMTHESAISALLGSAAHAGSALRLRPRQDSQAHVCGASRQGANGTYQSKLNPRRRLSMEVAATVQRWTLVLLLLVLLAVLLVSAELPTDGELSVCSTPCCTVEPSCSVALHVACSCNDEERIVLRKADIPPTVKTIHISNAERVTIYNDALTSLPLLTDFSLHGIVNVTIENGGMNMQSSCNLSMVRMEDIENVRVKSWAVTGAWDRELNFELAKINQLQIETDAFHYDSETPGLKLMLQDINMLVLDSKAFSAPIAEMALNNVRMEECHDQSFGGRTANTMFNNVSIANAQTRCVFGSDSRATLSVHSSRIDVLSSEAFSGQLRKLYISSSDFLTMQDIGVNLQLVELEVTNLFVQRLNSKALSVVADDSIRIHKMHVESLKKNALAGLLVKPTPSGFCPPVNIHQMEVTEAELGSLTFSECADLAVTDLIVHSMPTGLCPTESLTRSSGSCTSAVSVTRTTACPFQSWPTDTAATPGSSTALRLARQRSRCRQKRSPLGPWFPESREIKLLWKEKALFFHPGHRFRRNRLPLGAAARRTSSIPRCCTQRWAQ
ncbi:uncharacterized protein LOC122385732 isoform X2 [Amphibalanus amphitrite]|uniref:uncharacterized protein LOC122379307 isoform X2 n=1 Tax=Amphibalanus amphitrite TaxID=1232801 RepID=UPI001C8FC830|nr:uncharacterized protein LOC122379307 isoform X2 [Amphibalanus amphitrite]XP_043230125.1 uncharacterized protein LOC122385732 isoform X2 [Amphibalanus amphitrite]